MAVSTSALLGIACLAHLDRDVFALCVEFLHEFEQLLIRYRCKVTAKSPASKSCPSDMAFRSSYANTCFHR